MPHGLARRSFATLPATPATPASAAASTASVTAAASAWAFALALHARAMCACASRAVLTRRSCRSLVAGGCELGLSICTGQRGFLGGLATEQALDPAEKAALCGGRRNGRRWRKPRYNGRAWHSSHWGRRRRGVPRFCPWLRHGRWRVGQHALDDRLLLVAALLAAPRHGGRVFDFLSQFVAGFDVVQARVVVFEALEFVVGRLQRLVGHHQHIDALLEFDLGDLGALFVEQEGSHIHRHLTQHRGRVVLERFLLNDAQDLQRRAFRVADMARAAAARAGNGSAFGEGRAQALAAHFHQAEFADGAKLHAGAVLTQRIAQAVFHLAAIARLLHVDEVDDDQATEVAQAHLACHLVGGFQVGAGRGFLDVAAANGAR